MIKKITTNQLAVGMFVHDLDCGWMNHPFLKTQFSVKTSDMIRKIAKAGIKELYIDTKKGQDVEDAPTKEEVESQLDEQHQELGETQPSLEKRHTIEQEIKQARHLLKDTHVIVQNLMADARMGRLPDTDSLLPLMDKMSNSVFRNKDALISLSKIKQKDAYTYMHSVSGCILMMAFGRAMGFDRQQVAQAGIGALLFDVGKMMIPSEILNKPGKLTAEEFNAVKDHVLYGYKLLSQIPGLPDTTIEIAIEHHERIDGSGYPRGLKGDEISQLGQMAAIVDVYDALTSARCYQDAWDPTYTLKKMLEWSKHHFAPDLVQQFIRCIGIYPVGTLVELNNGAVGVVVEQGEKNLLAPVVRVVYDAQKKKALTPKDLDLGAAASLKVVGPVAPQKYNLNPYAFLQ